MAVALLASCVCRSKGSDCCKPPEPPAEDGYSRLKVTPQGGTFALPGGGAVRVPAGAVDEPKTIRVQTHTPRALNRLLYKRNAVSRHYAGRTVNGKVYPESEPWVSAGGVEILPAELRFRLPLEVELPAVPGVQLFTPLKIKVSQSLDAAVVQPGSIDARPTGNPDKADPTIPQSTHALHLDLKEGGSYAVATPYRGPEWVDCTKVDRNDPEAWAKDCRQCGWISTESAQFDVTVGQCEAWQVSSRIFYHDCPGTPVEEDTQLVLSPECGEMEPIQDLLNYRVDRVWAFEFHQERKRVTKALMNCCRSQQEITLALTGRVRILRKEDGDGRQAMEGSAGLTLVARQEGCESSSCQLTDASAGPVSEPWDVAAELVWTTALKPPRVHVNVSQPIGTPDRMSYIYPRGRTRGPDGVWGPWAEVKQGLEYTRMLGFGSLQGFVPHAMTRTYTSAEPLVSDDKYMVLVQIRGGEPVAEFSERFSFVVYQ